MIREVEALEVLLDNMGRGLVYVDKDKRIRLCNQKAKEITGIIFDRVSTHEAGVINEGDIVIIADNKLGEDDGNLSKNELSLLNINDNDIKENDMLIAIGVYKNKKIEPVYKYIREHQLRVPLSIDTVYLGFHLIASIDVQKKEITIKVNGKSFSMKYFSSVGHMVVIDGTTGRIKFFQAKGYSVRKEDTGALLRGNSFMGKSRGDSKDEMAVVGEKFLDLFDESELSKKLFHIIDVKAESIENALYEINKRPFICSILPQQDKEDSDKISGAYILIQDAADLEGLLDDRNQIIKQIEQKHKEDRLNDLYFPEGAFKCFVGRSPKAIEVKYMAFKASKNKFNVIITGESGTGKSKLAREIHAMQNPEAPFVEVNCNTITHSLFESELFGYVGGAFTGAMTSGKVGYFEAANGGTIFLDEIGEIPLEIQVKLLHVLQNKTIYRVGSSKPIKVDVRVIAATNKNLEEEVERGQFRQDLYYRINVFPIEIPPLRERKEDLYLLINQLLANACNRYDVELKQFSGEALQKMLSYDWPGNVRELENIIERAITLCESKLIYPEHLSIGGHGKARTLKELIALEEGRIIAAAMAKHGGNKRKVMEELDISRTVLYDKLKKYDL